MIKWIIGLLVVGAILVESDSLVWRLVGIAILLGVACMWLSVKLESPICFMIAKACAVALVVIIIGYIIAVILKD